MKAFTGLHAYTENKEHLMQGVVGLQAYMPTQKKKRI
jgi:hypothetical protein